MDKLWNELVTHHSFLVDVFNVASNQFCKANETPHELRTKYCLMYSTLMMVRWDHLSLLQRINTVLMIEGGGSVRVCFALHKFVISLVFFDVKLKYSMKKSLESFKTILISRGCTRQTCQFTYLHILYIPVVEHLYKFLIKTPFQG